MDTFQKVVLFSAIGILLIALLFIGIALSKATKSETWPPVIAECPDYWKIDGSGNATRCINVKDLGICPPKSGDEHLVMDFNASVFANNENPDCAKYNWAQKCKVSWDGITYGVESPCQTDNAP